MEDSAIQKEKPLSSVQETPDLLVDGHEERTCCLALATGHRPIPLLPQHSTVLLLSPVTSDDTHNPSAGVLQTGAVKPLGFLLVLNRWLRCQIWNQVVVGSGIFQIAFATSSTFLTANVK